MDYYGRRDEHFYKEPVQYSELSEIQKNFSGSSILITGGSGFIGSLLVEKFLRTCPDLKNIYLLMRPKRGVNAEERLALLFKCEIYDHIRKCSPEVFKKVKLINGDIALPMCGLKREDQDFFRKRVNYVIHVAACLRMNEPLLDSYGMNVRATEDLLDLSTRFENLKSFVYVSTAYSHCFMPLIKENFYSTGLSSSELKFMFTELDHNQIAGITPKVIGQRENSYSYTKAVAEDVIKDYVGRIPVGVVRPSIVSGCAKEPYVNWINNIYGITGVAAAAFPGFLRVWLGDENKEADIIPADYVVNATIAAAWDIARNWETQTNTEHDPIYNIVPVTENRITYKNYMDKCSEATIDCRTAAQRLFGEYFMFQEKRRWLFFLEIYIFHMIPALLVDTLLFLIGKSPMVARGYRKILGFNLAIAYYAERRFEFYQDNLQRLWKTLSDQDKQLFYFEMSEFEWFIYTRTIISAIKLYIFKEPMDNAEYCVRKYMRFLRARQLIQCILAYYCYRLIMRYINYSINILT